MLKRPPRTKPISVMPASSASAIARLDGADTAATSGTPASHAFCRISNEVRPLTNSSRVAGRQPASEEPPADDLVDGVVPPDVLGGVDDVAVERAQRGGVQAAGGGERLLERREAPRQRADRVGVDGARQSDGRRGQTRRRQIGTSAHAAGGRRRHLPPGIALRGHRRRSIRRQDHVHDIGRRIHVHRDDVGGARSRSLR